MNGKYVILCNEQGGILNDPVLLRIAEDEFWFSLSDSNIEWWLRGVNCKGNFRVSIAEIDVCPVEIQRPKSVDLMVDLVDESVCELPYYGLTEAKIGGRDVVISQLGFTGEKGYEIYLRDATYYAADMWNAVLAAGYRHNLMITALARHRRIAAGILSCGQEIDQETLPLQCNLAYQVPRKKTAPYIGKERLEQVRSEIEAGRYPFKNIMVGLTLGGLPITDCAGLLACIRAGRRNPRRLHDLALVFAQHVARCGPPIFGQHESKAGDRVMLRASQPSTAGLDEDPRQPQLYGSTAWPGEALSRPQEGALRDIYRCLRVAHNPVGQVVYQALVGPDKLVEGSFLVTAASMNRGRFWRFLTHPSHQ